MDRLERWALPMVMWASAVIMITVGVVAVAR